LSLRHLLHILLVEDLAWIHDDYRLLLLLRILSYLLILIPNSYLKCPYLVPQFLDLLFMSLLEFSDAQLVSVYLLLQHSKLAHVRMLRFLFQSRMEGLLIGRA